MDADEHSTVLMKDSHGRGVAKGHITSDEGKQIGRLASFQLLSVQHELTNYP
jgi:hypothetical protein